MSQGFDLSIAVSSFNRDDKVRHTLKTLFASDLDDFARIELIVVDDGSPRPVADLLPQIEPVPEKIELRLIRQENSGIGATRNRGFREAQSPIVLFLDDDILLPKDTLRELVRAQRAGRGAVIFGSYPFVSHESDALAAFARRLFGYDEITTEPRFDAVNAITSGLLCVDKRKLADQEKFYRDDLTVPAAEEYEIVYRFHELRLPIVHARHIHAIHNHHLELDWLVQQQFKYGLGTAEAFLKYEDIERLANYRELKRTLAALKEKNAKSLVKAGLASAAGRGALLAAVKRLDRLAPRRRKDFLFGLLTSAFYWAGYLEGERRFARA